MKDFTAQGKNEKKNMIDQGLLLIERTSNPVINLEIYDKCFSHIYWHLASLKAEFEALGKSLLKSLRGSLDIIHRLQLVGVPPNLQEQLMLGEQPDVILEGRDERRVACLNDLTKLEDKEASRLIPFTNKIRVELDQVVHHSHARTSKTPQSIDGSLKAGLESFELLVYNGLFFACLFGRELGHLIRDLSLLELLKSFKTAPEFDPFE